jgi:hypothetical protein
MEYKRRCTLHRPFDDGEDAKKKARSLRENGPRAIRYLPSAIRYLPSTIGYFGIPLSAL